MITHAPSTPTVPEDLTNVETGEESGNDDADSDNEEPGALKLRLKAAYTAGGTKAGLRVAGKSKRADLSDTSVEASPELPRSQAMAAVDEEEGAEKSKKTGSNKNQTKPQRSQKPDKKKKKGNSK